MLHEVSKYAFVYEIVAWEGGFYSVHTSSVTNTALYCIDFGSLSRNEFGSNEKPDNLRLQCPTLQTCLGIQEMQKFSFYLVRFKIYRQKTK